MAPKKRPSRVVVVAIDRGYAIVAANALDQINKRFQLIARIAACTTWGEYRALGNHEFEDDVWDVLELEDEPEDDEPFSVDLFDDEGETSRFDRNTALEVATRDLFDSITEKTLPHEKVEMMGPWAYVGQEHISEVLDALRAQGFIVENGD